MTCEIHIYKEGNFGFREMPPCGKKPTMKRLLTNSSDRRHQVVSILRPKRTNKDSICVGENLLNGIVSDIHFLLRRLGWIADQLDALAGAVL